MAKNAAGRRCFRQATQIGELHAVRAGFALGRTFVAEGQLAIAAVLSDAQSIARFRKEAVSERKGEHESMALVMR
jgi:hypothetical protein